MLRESGMHGAGIKEVVARSASPIGSLYHYFPGGKTQLVSEALVNHAAKVPRLIERFFDGRRSAAAAARALFDNAADEFERTGANKGCAIGAVALDLQASDTAVQIVCQQAFDDWAVAIAGRLSHPDERTRRSAAVMVVAALEGAFVLCRASNNGQPFRDVGKWVSAMLSANESKGRRLRRKTKTKVSAGRP